MSRECDGCSMCCKVISIKELDKPAGTWCRHCSTQNSCDIYTTRPDLCRHFICGYIAFDDLGEEWRPDRAKFVLAIQEAGRMTIHVDPDFPYAWREEPYHSKLREWAAAAVLKGSQIVVSVADHVHMIFPDRDVDLGPMRDNQMIKKWHVSTPMGIRFEASLVDKEKA